MTRTERLLRLARQRGDLLAVATLEAHDENVKCPRCGNRLHDRPGQPHQCSRWWLAPTSSWTEAELREAWGR